jgi:hypothetical protein
MVAKHEYLESSVKFRRAFVASPRAFLLEINSVDRLFLRMLAYLLTFHPGKVLSSKVISPLPCHSTARPAFDSAPIFGDT